MSTTTTATPLRSVAENDNDRANHDGCGTVATVPCRVAYNGRADGPLDLSSSVASVTSVVTIPRPPRGCFFETEIEIGIEIDGRQGHRRNGWAKIATRQVDTDDDALDPA